MVSIGRQLTKSTVAALRLYRVAALPERDMKVGDFLDVLHLPYIEQTECFMFMLKCPIDRPFSASAGRRKRSKAVDATHPAAPLERTSALV
jgi:hypothetical protein